MREGGGEGGREDDISYSHIRKQEAYMVSYVRVWALQASKRRSWRAGQRGEVTMVLERVREREGRRGSLEERGRRTHHCPLDGWRVVQKREKERLRRDFDATRGGVKYLHIRLLTLVSVCVYL